MQEMEDLVMACIQAKPPTCMLCMGAVSILPLAVFTLLDNTQTACAMAAPDTQPGLASPPTVVGCQFHLIIFMELLLCCFFRDQASLASQKSGKRHLFERWHIDWFKDVPPGQHKNRLKKKPFSIQFIALII